MADQTQDPSEQAEDQTAEEAQQAEGDGLPANSVDVEDAGTLRKKVTITVPRERIDAKLDEMFGELAQTAQVPGFRIGRAPRRLVEKRFGREVSEDVRNALVGESLGDAIEKAALKTLGEPDLDLDGIELPETGEMSYSFEVEVAPDFDLPELKGIQVEKRSIELTDERIDTYVDQLRQSRARHEAADAPAAEGDLVSADAVITGEGVRPHERKNLTLRVAPGQVEGLPLVDLPQALTGKKAGESASLSINVPETHPNEEWREKELSVELTITEVRSRILPELDDEFAVANGFDSLTDMREFVSNSMKSRLVEETTRAMRQQVRQYLLDNTDFELPEGVSQRHAARTLQRRYIDLLQQGIPRETIDERITELQAAATEEAKQELKLQFILGKIADEAEIVIDEAEVNSQVAQMAASYNRRPERFRHELEQDGTLAQVEVALREQKALDRLLEDAEVTEVSEAKVREQMEEARKKAPKTKKAKKAAKKKAKKADDVAEADGGKAEKKAPKAPKAAAEKKTAKKVAKKAKPAKDKDEPKKD